VSVGVDWLARYDADSDTSNPAGRGGLSCWNRRDPTPPLSPALLHLSHWLTCWAAWYASNPLDQIASTATTEQRLRRTLPKYNVSAACAAVNPWGAGAVDEADRGIRWEKVICGHLIRALRGAERPGSICCVTRFWPEPACGFPPAPIRNKRLPLRMRNQCRRPRHRAPLCRNL
jgi:hypothetical protein